jgi:hypothetical protein
VKLTGDSASPVLRYGTAILFAYTPIAAPRHYREKRINHMKLLAASAFALGLGLMTMSAQAMPLAPLDHPAASPDIIHVAQGCGPGFHRGPAGACRTLYNCPPGWHTGPYGKRCFRN